MEDETYKLTPRGIAIMAMLQVGLITNTDDPRAEGFWTIFEYNMRKLGYAEEGENE